MSTPPFAPCSRDEALAAQEDLGALCADRPFDPVELFRPNAYYGLARILKAYAGVREDRPLRIALPHGVEMDSPTELDRNVSRREAVPVIASYAEGFARHYEELGALAVWPMAHPLLYLRAMLGSPPAERRGTIYFPTHSGLKDDGESVVQALFDRDAVLEQLRALPSEAHPVTVCIYWVDQRFGLHEPYEEAGLRVVSAGHMADPQFLARFLHLCASHTFAASNDVGSHCFYAMAAGCRYLHLNAPSRWDDWDVGHEEDPVYLETRERLRVLAAASPEEQEHTANAYLGARHLESPEGLCRTLRRAEQLDRIGVCRHPGDGWLQVTGPWFLRRRAAAAATRFQKR